MRALLTVSAVATLILCALWAYWPGLQGGFLFDDFYNLDALGQFGSVRHPESLLLYLSSGTADPLGRPLSLLSFLIDAGSWPADPLPFKRTNLILHLLNGLLLIAVLLRLGRARELPGWTAAAAATLAGGLWLLHPLWVSTTLYVVQREAMLPATCTLLAILLWLEGRSRFLAHRPRAVVLLFGSAWLLTLIAALCKANGVLLPLLLLVIEFTLLADAPATATDTDRWRRYRHWRLVLLGLPAIAIAAALAHQLMSFTAAPYELRGWNGYQHLISEPRVLMDYLHQLFIPHASTAGLFNDSYPASRDLLHPASTLSALVAVLALACFAIALRRQAPIVAFAVLFYLAAQLLESSAWPLELYFEHRNYLAAMPLFWPFAVRLFTPPVSRPLALMAAFMLLAALTALTHSRAAIWGDPQRQARLMMNDPRIDSPRATIIAANDAIAAGQAPIAAHWLRRSLAIHPDDLPMALTLLTTDCASDELPPEDLAIALRVITIDRAYLSASALWFSTGTELAGRHSCTGLDWNELDQLFAAAMRNPGFASQSDYRHAYWHARGESALARGDAAAALDDFNRALLERRDHDLLLAQMAELGSSGHPDLGLAHLRYFRTLTADVTVPPGMPRIHHWLLLHLGYWDSGLQQITAQLEQDARAQPPSGP